MKRVALLLAAAVVASVAPSSGAGNAATGDARYSVDKKKMDAARTCMDAESGNRAQPVLLVHGTGVDAETNWGWNYLRALPDAGFDVCTVDLPKSALGDAQISAEYVARAVQMMHRRYGTHVDVLGHSQGGLVQRWAIKWFPSGDKVDDAIALASPDHGTTVSDESTVLGYCFPSCWQMQTDSKFTSALNRGDETPGDTWYTSIYTQTDELVQPPRTAKLQGGTNIKIQDVCPGRTVDHIAIAGDGAVYDMVLDALSNPGPTKLSRLPEDICLQGAMEGSGPSPDFTPPGYDENMWTDDEPPLKPYARK